MRRQWKGFIAGIIVSMFAIGFIGTATATIGSRTVNIDYNNIKVTMDGRPVDLVDGNGDPIEPFIINGTTYLPVRAVANAMGLGVDWDSQTSTVILSTDGNVSDVSIWLTDLNYFSKSDETFRGFWHTGSTVKDNTGTEHEHSLNLEPLGTTVSYDFISYLLDGKYMTLSGTFFQKYNYRSNSGKTTLKILGDDKVLWTGEVSKEVTPVEFSVDVSSVKVIKFELNGNGSCHCTAIGDLILKS